MAATHHYRAHLSWSGSTGGGYHGYRRAHRLTVAGTTLTASADPAYLGDGALPNPENLLLAAASSCQMLAFLALAARAGLDVRDYTDDAEAEMPATRDRMRITRIVLRPNITLAPGADRARVAELVEQAHEECFIANTLDTEIVLDPSVTVPDS
ncbi:OsmC family protein [Jatrophihabitans endophyticus]|uniref:OsmC family protein n=1 Tax=Jatrophihabitans endophyticus TaxID=1206085 RepID=UPI0019DDC2C9|nr:OsmC family protein [Jatrophihabitans endophyticus]MBE7186789.1 OsmC family protein [Jatrophihabitans endophyticus]